jgi:hypothetical protein
MFMQLGSKRSGGGFLALKAHRSEALLLSSEVLNLGLFIYAKKLGEVSCVGYSSTPGKSP